MSKRILSHPEEPATGRKYWRSVGQLQNSPEFKGWLEREFPQGASEFNGGEVSRRNFLQLMGASLALAGLSFAGCRRPEKHLVPFTKGVEWSIPGKALFYTTSMPGRKGFQPVVATTYDGRPTKIEGNPLHPVTGGATDVFAQASLLNLYDPDRAKTFTKEGGQASTEAEFEKALDELIKGAGDGTGLAFLLEEAPSPTRERLRSEIEKKFPKALWTTYEPLGGEQSVAVKDVFGEGLGVRTDFSKANVILSLDCDFLGQDGDCADSRGYSRRRRVEGQKPEEMNRLYVVENRYTVTGGMADHRQRVPASQIGAFLAAVAAEVGAQTNDGAIKAVAAAIPNAPKIANADWIKPMVADLVKNKGKSVVLVGPRQPFAVQALGFAINSALGNLGQTLVGVKVASRAASSIAELAQQMGDKKIKTLVVVGGNPVYNAPADLDFANKVLNVDTLIRLGAYNDETAPLADWHVPLAHYLESWGDGYSADGGYVSVQPMIMPLYSGWSEFDILAKFAGYAKPHGPELIQETFRQVVKPADFVWAWAKFLHDGFVENFAPAPSALAYKAEVVTAWAAGKLPLPAPSTDTFEVVLTASSSVDDGRYANNGWLQECPDPVTKLTWDNAAWISPKSAAKLKVETGDMIEISLGDDKGPKVTIPVLIAPGHADNSLTIPLGYGRTAAGRVGSVAQTSERYVFGDDMISGGFNAYPLTTSNEGYVRVGAKVRVTGKNYRLAITQEHGSLEGRGADLVREGTLETFKQDPGFAKNLGMDSHIPKNFSLYTNPPLNKPDSDDPHAWGMTVDLNACTGCGACMVACQAENNIPVVGKRQVIDGREMHWIRCDRYFVSGPSAEGKDDYDQNVDDPEMVSEPMMCQHCENAPCETVCPVNATVHSEDGLNVMAYNRCIGTRYCANNCPFKVRRFNFFDYNERQVAHLRKWNLISERGMEDSLKLSKNPNVTVRMRGVMEKCSFCVQRIQEAKIAAKVAHRDKPGAPRIPTDAFDGACGQVCASEAIVFGDINNPESKVSKVRASQRAYEMLKYLNIGSRVLYLARIRNPNPEMPDAKKVGAHIKQHHGHGHGDSHGAGHGAEKANHGGAH